jgi:hypothetical protein
MAKEVGLSDSKLVFEVIFSKRFTATIGTVEKTVS